MGRGMFTSIEIVESLIIDLNNLPKELMNGQFIHACNLVSHMAQKLANLKKSICADLQNKDEVIAQLKAELKKAGVDVIDCKPEELETVLSNIANKKE